MEGFGDLLRATARHVGAQCGTMRGELGHVQCLLDDAILDLTDCFHQMHDAAPAPPDDGVLHRAITALQFHDMVTQLLGHVTRRIDALDEVMRQFTGLGATLDREAATADMRAAIASLREEQARVAAALVGLEARITSNPVGQKAMTRGDIELF